MLMSTKLGLFFPVVLIMIMRDPGATFPNGKTKMSLRMTEGVCGSIEMISEPDSRVSR